jgi:pyruvate dehydrogenase E2 component (dihydrolipoamide acetyltransferase)
VASPLARRLAAEQNVALSDIAGTGANGRIRRADVEGAIAARNATSDAPVPRPSAIDLTSTAIGEQQAAANGGKGETQRVELTRLQVTVARRMAEAKATVPEFSVTRTINVGPVLAFRRELKTAIEPPPSFNDLIVKACALALREHPKVNGSYRDGAFDLYSRVNIGVAVASEDALVVPTVFDADLLSLGAIAKETRRLAKLVRESRIAPPDLASGTFTVSNLGMHGIARFQAIINPPQAAILAVGAASKNDELDLTLSCDHRILYGTDAAGFLATVGQLLEEPLGLLG